LVIGGIRGFPMKRTLLALMLLTTPSMVATTITKADIIATVEHQRKLVHQAQADADLAKKELVVVQDAINAQTAKLHDTENRLAIVSKERDSALHHLHLLLSICSSLAGAVGFLVAIRFASFLPPNLIAYEFLFASGVGIVVGGLAWAILGHL
jgi:hypothetical protein